MSLEESLNALENNQLTVFDGSYPYANSIRLGSDENLWDRFLRALPTAASLVELNLSNTRLQKSHLLALAKALQHNQTLKSLILAENDLTDEEVVKKFNEAFRTMQLTTLDLSQCFIKNPDIISNFLLNNDGSEWHSCLEKLILNSNELTSKNQVIISGIFNKAKNLHVLSLNYNVLGEKGAEAIIAALKKNHGLQALHIINNKMGDKAFTEFCKAIYSSQLTQVTVMGSDITEKSKSSLTELIKQNLPKLREFVLSRDDARRLGNLSDLITVLKKNSVITNLGEIAKPQEQKEINAICQKNQHNNITSVATLMKTVGFSKAHRLSVKSKSDSIVKSGRVAPSPSRYSL